MASEQHARGKIYEYPKVKLDPTVKLDKNRAALDPNHSHFVLVDDGTTGATAFGAERGLRNEIEDAICEAVDPDDDDALQTPMVLLVVSGGLGTLDVIIRTLKDDRPCIVLAETGGVATQIYDYVEKGVLPKL